MDKDKPAFISRDGMIADKDYVKWLADIKQRFQHCQLKTSVRINTAMLEFYWSIGRDLVNLRVEDRWGDKVVKQFSLDMRNTFPNETGFSHSNVKYMKQWYSFYYERVVIGQQLIGQLVSSPKEQSYAGFFDMPESFGMVPWGHHISIISR